MPSIASYKINEWHERKNYKTGTRRRLQGAAKSGEIDRDGERESESKCRVELRIRLKEQEECAKCAGRVRVVG